MDKDISLKGIQVQLAKSITNYDDYSSWGLVDIARNDDCIVVNRSNAAGGWGIVSNKIGFVKANMPYILEFDYRTRDVERFSYNYFISSDGNAAFGRLEAINDDRWHTIKTEIESGKDRTNCGILIGTDYRNTAGDEFYIKNIRLYPKESHGLSGVEAKEVLSYRSGKWQKVIGYVKSDRWIEFIRPAIQVWDGVSSVAGMTILRDTTLRDRGIRFDSDSSISASPINPNLIDFNEIYNSATELDKSKYKESGEIILTTAGTYQGLFIRYPEVKPNTVYSFSYEYKVLEGELVNFGGHADTTYFNNKCYLNKNYMTDNYNEWDSVYDFNTTKDKNYVHIVTTTPDNIVALNRLFIQPNRGREEMVKVRISNMKLEMGEKVTPWSYDKE